MCSDSAQMEEIMKKLNRAESKSENFQLSFAKSELLKENIKNFFDMQMFIQNYQAKNYYENLNYLANLVTINNMLSMDKTRNPFYNNDNIGILNMQNIQNIPDMQTAFYNAWNSSNSNINNTAAISENITYPFNFLPYQQ